MIDCVRVHGAFVSPVDAVIFELVNHILQVHERIVDRFDLNFRIVHACAKDETTNPAKAIDPHGSGWHFQN